ncbi:N-ethylammeline chlorohydrolase [Streptococcus pneumoniae]|nr:hypothetical protein [Streptococcus pneumoniae]CAG6064315.1 N-ethylammeline chlorohydrolase [Streptococcus pneumoniae]
METDEVSSKHSKHCFEVVDGTDKVSNHIRQGDVDGFEEIFEEYQ